MSNNNFPLVSFAIPSYNHEKYIGEMLDSCIAQTYPNIEVVVVDDASTDNSRRVIESYVQRYPDIIRAEFNATNLGQALTARIAVRLTRGDYIAGNGSDDVSLPHRIAAGMELLLANPALGAVFSKAEIIDETSQTINSPITKIFNCQYDDIRWRLLAGNFLCGPSMLVRGDLIRKISPNPNLRYVEDFDQSLRILDTHELLRVDDVWVKYRSHGKNLSVHTVESVPFAGNYETAISILSAMGRWPIDKLHSFKSSRESPEYNQELALAHCRLARHCFLMDDTLFGRPFLFSSEAYRQLLIATESDPSNEEAAKLLNEVWKRLGDHPRAQGKKPISFVDWEEQQTDSSNTSKMSAYATNRQLSTVYDDYERWQQSRYFVSGDISIVERANAQRLQAPKIHLVMRLPQGLEKYLADTLDSLIQQIYGDWHLDVITTLPSPDGLEELPCIGWNSVGLIDEAKETIDRLVTARNFDWVIELPAGARLDLLCLWRLAMEINAKSDTRALFADDDCCNDSGHRHSPRFKPGNNPAALQSADLAGPICVRRDTWQLTGGASQRGGSPWFSQLLRITDKFGWSSIQHIPDVLFSYPDSFPCDQKSTVIGLIESLQEKGIAGEIVPMTGQSWCIRYPLGSAPKVSIAILSQGQLDLLSRCLDSVIENTAYPAFDIIIAVSPALNDPNLTSWLGDIRGKSPHAVNVIKTEAGANHAKRCNLAVSASTNDLVLLLREETVIIEDNWLEELVRTCLQPEIAAVSPCLIAPGTGLIQDAGSVLGLNGIVGSPYQDEVSLGTHGYLDCLKVARDVTALPASCLLVRKAAYMAVDGMNETELGDYMADTDLSLKLRKAKHRLIYQPLATVVYGGSTFLETRVDSKQNALARIAEVEAKTFFYRRWQEAASIDPFWNPNFSLVKPTPTIETEFRAQWQYLPSNTSRILARPIANAQGDFRISSPLRASRMAGLAAECIWLEDGPRQPTTAEIVRLAPTSLIVQNFIFDHHLAALRSWEESECSPFIVYALDDLITDMDASNPCRKKIPANSRARLKYALSRCSRLVVSTDFLAETYRHFIPDIRVVPNRLEKPIWLPLQTHKRSSNKPRIGWAGGTTHQGDLVLLKEVIEQTKAEADWVFFGMCPEELRPLLAEYHSLVPLAEYPARLAALNLDIAVAPLAQTAFNRGKSNLRLLEYGVLGIPVVCTDIDPYRASPACRVENNVTAWVEALRARIHDTEAREREGLAMQQWVHQNYLLEDHLEEWLQAHLPD